MIDKETILLGDAADQRPATPESVRGRCTKSHEYIFLLSKSERYHFDCDAIREPFLTADRKGARRSYRPGCASSFDIAAGHQAQKENFAGLPPNPKGRRKRDVWSVSTSSFNGAHFAVFPEKVAESCVLAGCPEGGTVPDPFAGSGTIGVVAKRLRQSFIGIGLSPEHREMAVRRIDDTEMEYEQMEL